MRKFRNAAAKLAGLPGLMSVFRGVRRRGRKWTGEETLTCFVRRKRACRQLPKDERIPRAIHGIPTDVIAIGRPRTHTAIDTDDQLIALYDQLGRRSAISALVDYPSGGMIALGSGHGLIPVAGSAYASGQWKLGAKSIGVYQEQVSVGSLWRGSVGDDADYAVARFPDLSPPQALDGHVFASAPIPVAPRALQAGDTVQHLASQRGYRVTGSVVAQSLQHVPITLQADQGITIQYHDVIAVVGTDLTFSVPGESGSLVFDANRQAAGFVIGAGKDPDQASLSVSFVLRSFSKLRSELDDLYSLFFNGSGT